jgi:hypothetical protein
MQTTPPAALKMIKRRTQSGMTRDYHCPFK